MRGSSTLAGVIAELSPPLTFVQIRAICRLGVVLRWIAIAFAGLAGLLAPRVPALLPEEMLAAVVYNGLVTLAVMRAKDEDLRTLALVTTVIDQLFCFTFLAIYNVIPGGQQVAAYVPGMIEATAFFGAAGTALSLGIFVVGILVVQSAGIVFWRAAFEGVGIFAAIMILVLLGACLAGVNHVLYRSLRSAEFTGDDLERALEVGLSVREQEVLRQLAEGCSNAMIAGRLGVSERTVKTSVEKLLTRLRARNRAEAVAAASRLRLL